MNKFKVGDLVQVIQKIEPSGFFWTPDMDQYIGDGGVYSVIRISPVTSNVTLNTRDGATWGFPEDSLKLVATTSPPCPKQFKLVGSASVGIDTSTSKAVQKQETQAEQESLVGQRRALRRFLGG